jgi:hypothetical protein
MSHIGRKKKIKVFEGALAPPRAAVAPPLLRVIYKRTNLVCLLMKVLNAYS